MQTDEPLFDQLAVLDDFPAHGGPLNMAVDEVLLDHLEGVPILRLYRWSQPTVSFGFFGAWQSVTTDHPKHDLVRRWTGGGMVEHGEDTTYSLLIPRSHALTNHRASESYRLIHTALLRALKGLQGGQLRLNEVTRSAATIGSNACFASPVAHDIIFEGSKVSGAAQRRTRTGLLHQGSVHFPGQTQTDAAALIRALPTVFARSSFPCFLSSEEVAAAKHLAAEKYASEAWLKRI